MHHAHRLKADDGIAGEERRLYPSAGSLHPIEVVVCGEDAPRLYLASRHALGNVSYDATRYRAFLADQNRRFGTSGLMLTFIAQHDLTATKYSRHWSLVLRDAGAAIMMTQLVAEALGMTFRPLGTLGKGLTSSLDRSGLLPVGTALFGI